VNGELNMKGFIICNLHFIVFGILNQGGRDN
jgi:hypothetical protein